MKTTIRSAQERRNGLREFLTLRRVLIGLILIGGLFVLYWYLPAFMPLILALVTALILEPLIQFIQKILRLKHRLSAVIMVFIFFVCLIGALFYLAITKLINEALKFVNRLPYYISQITFYVEQAIDRLNETIADLPQPLIDEISKQNVLVINKANELSQQALALLASWAQGIPNLIIWIIIYLITLFLISKDLPRYKLSFYNMFNAETAEKVRYMSQRLSRVFTGFLKAQFLVSIVIFIVSYIGLLIISPKNALLMSFIIWVIDVIPIVGSIVILAPWATFALLSGATSKSIQLMILALILLIIRRILEPKVMGDHIGLKPLPTLLGIYLGYTFLGLVGLIAGPLIIITIRSAKEAGLIRFDFKI